jgi:hypothetical protein
MSIISILVVLVVVGLVLWAVQTAIPMDANIKRIITVVVVLCVCLWLLEQFGLIGPWHFGNGRLR